MKKMLLAAGIVLSVFIFAACTSQQQQQFASALADVQSHIGQACDKVQPQLDVLKAVMTPAAGTDPTPAQKAVADLVDGNAKLCAKVASLTLTGVPVDDLQALVKTLIPAAVAAVDLLPLDPAVRLLAKAALGEFGAALQQILQSYGTSTTAAPVAASGAISASASGAAS